MGAHIGGESNAHLAHLALPATFHAIPKVDFRRARRHILTHRASMARRAALILTTHLSTFCCCLLAGRTRDLLRLWHRGWAPSWPTLPDAHGGVRLVDRGRRQVERGRAARQLT